MGKLCPKFFLTGSSHLTLAFRTSPLVPDADPVTTALQTQPSHFAAIGGGHVGDDAAHHDVLDRVAVGAGHGSDLLTE